MVSKHRTGARKQFPGTPLSHLPKSFQRTEPAFQIRLRCDGKNRRAKPHIVEVFAELQRWFLGETLAAVNRGGQFRRGFEVVKRAILRCVPGADKIWYDHSDQGQIVLSINGHAQPFSNLSAGQRMMLALIADLAIKSVTQNAFLLPPDKLGREDEPLPRVLRDTPGLVLIDERDVHLHPIWQRRVATDLQETFPGIQFVCTSHSPQVIGEVSRDQVRLLTSEGVNRPSVARGADSNWILDHVMKGAISENRVARALEEKVEDALEDGNLPLAREKLHQLRQLLNKGNATTLRPFCFAKEPALRREIKKLEGIKNRK